MVKPDMSNARNGKPPDPPSQCIFCDSLANSGEHLWSHWMRTHFKRTAHDKSLETYERYRIGNQSSPIFRTIHGHPTTRKFKVVCHTCNTGWMSLLETVIKPSLEPMISGRSAHLGPSELKALTEWIVLKMMVFDRYDDGTTMFSRDETLAFSRDRSFPDGIVVWVFRTADRHFESHIGRSFAGISAISKGLPSAPVPANVQATIFGLGRLLIYFVHSRHPELKLGAYKKSFGKRLWPPASNRMVWPPLNAVSAADTVVIADTLRRFVTTRGILV